MMTRLERFETIAAEMSLARKYLDDIEHALQNRLKDGLIHEDLESAYISGCMADDMVTSVRYHLREFTH